jgi:hypothetical protein
MYLFLKKNDTIENMKYLQHIQYNSGYIDVEGVTQVSSSHLYNLKMLDKMPAFKMVE